MKLKNIGNEKNIIHKTYKFGSQYKTNQFTFS